MILISKIIFLSIMLTNKITNKLMYIKKSLLILFQIIFFYMIFPILKLITVTTNFQLLDVKINKLKKSYWKIYSKNSK